MIRHNWCINISSEVLQAKGHNVYLNKKNYLGVDKGLRLLAKERTRWAKALIYTCPKG
jgi:hypothetical protein